MNKNMIILILIIIFCIVSILLWYRSTTCSSYGEINAKYVIKNRSDIPLLFPRSVHDINSLVRYTECCTQRHIQQLLAIPHGERTFINTAQALDIIAGFNAAVAQSIISSVALTYADDAVRVAAEKAQVQLSAFIIDTIAHNKQLYEAFTIYVENNAHKENLSPEQQYFLQETIRDFKRTGLDLPEEKREQVKSIYKKLSALSVQFEQNISTDKRTIQVTREELAGLEDDFINSLQKTADGKYIVTTDYPNYFPVIEHCIVEQTRKNIWIAFNNRAYPDNIEILNSIIALRDELAHLLGYESYAAYNIDGQMAQSPGVVRNFLQSIVDRARIKERQEFQQVKDDLPPSVTLVEGKLQPWDVAFVKTTFKKKHYDSDDREIARYFPMEKTVQGLLYLYEQFFGITLKKSPIETLWDEDLQLIEVYEKNADAPKGYLILDLYPRSNKFTHACQITIVPALQQGEQSIPGVSVVLANFTKPTPDKPSLLKLHEVRTFFHEFGHALHALFGATQLASFSGTNVKQDFVEMPSQMLEEWLYNKDILRSLSSHYQTGQPLPDSMLETILKLKNFSSGAWSLGQLMYSFMALDYFGPGSKKDTIALMAQLSRQLLPNTLFNDNNHMPASFGHLMGYGARYYGYLWSKVFALDLFKTIEKEGLLNQSIGTKYARTVLMPGGSKDPNEMLRNFLGREPNADAFFHDLGL